MTIIQISAVGDLLMWKKQIDSAKKSRDAFSFDFMFNQVAPYLRQSDLTIGNLETTLSGRELHYQKRNPKTGWPMFNCPDELAPALRRAGFDVLTTANNHCMDRGAAGLKRTLEILDAEGLDHTGTSRTKQEADSTLIKNVKGIQVGILSYTYGTNRIPVPDREPWLVNRIKDSMLKEIYEVKKKVDFLIVCLHFGREFRRYPSRKQKSWVQKCFNHGADAVLGVHPHVIQPMEVKTVKDLHGITKERFVIYSLGNFTSIKMLRNMHSLCGVILNMTIEKEDQGTARIKAIHYIPTWVNQTDFKVLPLLNKDLSHFSPALKRAWISTTNHLKGNPL